MTIKQLGGVFGRNPTFNDVTIEGELTFDGDIDINSNLKVSGELEVIGNINSTGRMRAAGGSDQGTQLNMWTTVGGDGSLAAYQLVFNTGPNDARVEGARFTPSGNLAFVSGKGIDFSATAGAGTSELLDDYEEGAWTPLISQDGDGAVPFTSVTQSGAYTKVGNLVTVTCLYEYSGIGSVGNNFAYMGGLPFTAADNSIYGYGFSFFEQSAYDTKSYSIAALSNAAKAFFQYDNGGGTLYVGTPRMVGNSFPSAAKVRFTLTYIAA